MLRTVRGGIIQPLQRTGFGRAYSPVVKSDCGQNGEVALDPQSVNGLVNENGITLAGCGQRALLKVVLCDMEDRKYECIAA